LDTVNVEALGNEIALFPATIVFVGAVPIKVVAFHLLLDLSLQAVTVLDPVIVDISAASNHTDNPEILEGEKGTDADGRE
jgi:hypothetical protein